jgi:TRAP-type mannitol/chloroaromatic compound transport system permease small subunit
VPRAIRLYVKAIDAIAEKIGLVTMYLVVAMILILLLNAISRNAFVMPISWGMEMAQFMLAAYYIVGGAYSLQLDDHVRMDLLYSRLSDKGKARLDAFTSFFLVFYLVCLLIGSISSAIYAIETDERRFSMWNPSMIPIKLIMVGGIVLMLLQALSLFFKSWAKARGRDLG